MIHTKDWMDVDEALGFKQVKGRFNRAQALKIKCQLRQLAWH